MKFAVILSGCGVFDGTEIGEAICTLLAMEDENECHESFIMAKINHHLANIMIMITFMAPIMVMILVMYYLAYYLILKFSQSKT